MRFNLIKIGEAAELLGVSIDTLRRWDKAGKFLSVRTGSKGHRFYRFSDIESKLNSASNYRNLAREWVQSTEGFSLDPQVYCETRDMFQARLETLQSRLGKMMPLEKVVSLVIAVAGEIGNNSFDHNLGNWSDIMGIFFYYDERNKSIILADRGQGILSTLKRVKPELDNAKEALRVAFTEIISGRQPEARGNGLKFVKSIIINNSFSLDFQTGNAFLHLKQNDEDLFIQEIGTTIKGCFATIKIERTI
ncbi:MAG: helix-turn-helix domain-containing protein [Patescibacteria group bacterium]